MTIPALLSLSLLAVGTSAFGQDQLLNVSYDPTRALYQDVNAAFANRWKAHSGRDLIIN